MIPHFSQAALPLGIFPSVSTNYSEFFLKLTKSLQLLQVTRTASHLKEGAGCIFRKQEQAVLHQPPEEATVGSSGCWGMAAPPGSSQCEAVVTRRQIFHGLCPQCLLSCHTRLLSPSCCPDATYFIIFLYLSCCSLLDFIDVGISSATRKQT